jgi:4-amino-4-deoxy-L-arabinose transferase-like glycosyltransferase
MLHLALGLATVWITYGLAGRWGLGRHGALTAALLVACDPLLLAGSALVMTETLAALLAVASLACLTAASERASPGRVAAGGAVMALAVLCRPTFLPWTLLAAVFLPWLAARAAAVARARAALGTAACFAAAAALVLAPWALRNQLQFGRPIVTTTHGGYTLLLGNNPYFYEHLRSAPWGSVWLAGKLQEDLARRVSPNTPAEELAADQAAYDLAWETIRAEPGTFAYSCAVRVGRLWSPLPHQLSPDEGVLKRWARRGVGLWYALELPLALVGIGVLWRKASCWNGADQAGPTGENGEARQDSISPLAPDRSPQARACSARAGVASGRIGAWWIAILAATVTALHTLYWADMRMRALMMPALALAASAGLGWVATPRRRRK